MVFLSIPMLLLNFSAPMKRRNESIKKKELYDLVEQHHFKTSIASYELMDEGHFIQYELTVQTKDNDNLEALASGLISNQLIVEFRLTPLGGR